MEISVAAAKTFMGQYFRIFRKGQFWGTLFYSFSLLGAFFSTLFLKKSQDKKSLIDLELLHNFHHFSFRSNLHDNV